ncbi:hypothetical protein CROQUDRAFT_86284 [Cronartium quercuum f. sp. fusiforme G11]|uniref:Uncharacterized protein n=1 Tax=Cronartium quercuum f. sp. fusiforme G11 TaxID=708437 RepID=A0A9P6NYC6_9BASI|nr:hypothetical protein CROQUDRAFT_86284 [Cronartium quercuum f. sp. fusiforme G11]
MEKLRPISGKGLRELPVSRSSEGSGHEVPSSFGRPEAPPETVRRSSEDWGLGYRGRPCRSVDIVELILDRLNHEEENFRHGLYNK